HPLHAERDGFLYIIVAFPLEFQSTLSMRRGTGLFLAVVPGLAISIHPLHAERDPKRSDWQRWSCYFNPPSPCGEGRKNEVILFAVTQFQSTLSMRRGTTLSKQSGRTFGHFNPPSPCGEGQSALLKPFLHDISIHPLHAERDPTSAP